VHRFTKDFYKVHSVMSGDFNNIIFKTVKRNFVLLHMSMLYVSDLIMGHNPA
jgi:hypothetical protein